MVEERNAGIPFDETLLHENINTEAIAFRAKEIEKYQINTKEEYLVLLIRLVTVIDLTTLAGDDTEVNVRRLCAKASKPINVKVLDMLKQKKLTTAAICVYANRVKEAKKFLNDEDIGLASVAAGFPAGQTPLEERLGEIRKAISDGATEIDIVISRNLAISGKWKDMYNEIKAMKDICGDAHLKCILATGELPTQNDVYIASMVCMMAGADFIKTSTGKEKINATLIVGLVMARAVRKYYNIRNIKVGIKPAGGISTANSGISWLLMMEQELGIEWTTKQLFRIGASSLLNNIEQEIDRCIYGYPKLIYNYTI